MGRQIIEILEKPMKNKKEIGKSRKHVLEIPFERAFLLNNKFLHFWTWNPDSGPFQPVPGRKFDVESEFEVKNLGFRRPGAKN